MVPVEVRFVDMSRRDPNFAADQEAAVVEVLRSGQYLLGPRLEEFEREFAHFTGFVSAVGVASGTDALRLAMQAMDIGPGDEVIVPAMTAVPTAASVCAVGATPVIVDIDPRSAMIDVEKVSEALSPATKAVIPVHLYGRPAPVSELARLGVSVIEDAAQAHGALPSGAGREDSFASAYSFYPTKNLGAPGDGGAVVTNDAALAERLRRIRFHGQTELYNHVEIATNSRLSEVAAASLSVSLGYLPEWTARRREIAGQYLAAAPEMRWQTPHPDHVYHLAVACANDRDRLRSELSDRGIATAVHYPRSVVEQPAYRQFERAECVVASKWARECVSLPCYPQMTDSEVNRVCDALVAVADKEFAQ